MKNEETHEETIEDLKIKIALLEKEIEQLKEDLEIAEQNIGYK